MRSVAIIGSGISGLIASHGLLRKGFEVTLYSDRTGEQWLNESRPTGTAARFDLALSYERELGLNFWDNAAPKGEGVFLTFCPVTRNPLVRLLGRFEEPFQAVDVRLQSWRWMEEFVARGGRLMIENVTAERLPEIASSHDLTIVTTGRADLCRIFPRDESRSRYSEPQRKLAMFVAAGAPLRFAGCPFTPVRFDFLGTDGEIFFVPYHHKVHGPTWNVLIEARPGSRMDRFEGARSGVEVLRIAKALVAELFPWDAAFMQPMELADPLGWLVGSVTPVVRHPVARLESGHYVTALGDTSISFDPIAAQGANNGVKQARHLASRIAARGTLPFDETWMRETFEQYFESQGRHAVAFSDLLLEPITGPARELLIAQHGSDGRTGEASARQRIANHFVENFNDPRLLTPALTDMRRSRDVIADLSGTPWLWNGIRGRAAIAGDQVMLRMRPPRSSRTTVHVS